jgi:hypothetical protein
MQFNVVDDTLFLLFYGVPTALLLYMLVVSREAGGALVRLPATLYRFLFFTIPTRPRFLTSPVTHSSADAKWRTFATRKFSPREQESTTMLKREVERHNSATAHKKLAS